MQKSTIPKQLRCLTLIFENILNNPHNDRYRNLNFNRISNKLNESYIQWLYNAGFEVSNDNTRLLLHSSNIDLLKEVYESLMLITQSSKNTDSSRTKSQPLYNVVSNSKFQITEQKSKHTTFDSHHLLRPTNIDSATYNCQLNECLPLELIGTILKHYQLYLENITSDECKHNNTIQQIYDSIGNNYDNVDLLNDYNHLLSHHSNSMEFEEIYNILCCVVYDGLSCDLQSCLPFIRNRRDRKMHDNELNDLYFNEDHISQQLIDRIHCQYFHSFDIGYRITEKEREYILTDMVEIKQSNDSIESDEIVVKLNNLLNDKKQSNHDNLSVSSKFSSGTDNNKYHFGHRYYYWPYYKAEFTSIDDVGAQRYHPDQSALKNWYVNNKYSNFKEELLNNAICTISQFTWLELEETANIHLKTSVVREMFCARGLSAKCYGMIHGQVLQQNHLISMMSYCNYTILQFKFTETFRRLHQEESDQELISRHSNYHFFGRFLRETVECFGMNAPKCGSIKTYHGVSRCFTFESMDPYITGPFSMTTDYSVAVSFSANIGMILEFNLDCYLFRMGMADIEGNDALNRICCFDCRFISDFSNESEIFSIGGSKKLIINNIIEAKTGTNYEFYIKGIHLMSRCISSGGLPTLLTPNNRDELQVMYRLLCHELFIKHPKHPMAKEFKCPKYIKTALNQHCDSITAVVMGPHPNRNPLEAKQFELLDKVLKNENGWLDVQTITKLFPNVTVVKYHINDDVLFLNQQPSLFELILSWITNNAKLETIEIILFPNAINHLQKDFWMIMEQYKSKFVGVGWGLVNLNMREALNAYHLNEEILNQICLKQDVENMLASSTVTLFFEKTAQPNMEDIRDYCEIM